MSTAKTYVPDCISNLKFRRDPEDKHPEEHKFTPKIKIFWQFLVHEMGDDEELTCEVKEWAGHGFFKVSPQTVRNWLRFFEERKLIKITGGGQGRGRKWVIQFTDWIKKKIELAKEGIRSITKERLKELEAEYLKSVSWTTKNTKNPNKVVKHSSLKDSLRSNTQVNSLKAKKTSATWKDFKEKLKDTDDQAILEGQGTEKFDWFMAMVRKWLWKEHGLSRKLDDLISNAIGAYVKGKTFDFAIRVWNRLRENIGKIMALIEKVVSKSQIYSIVRKFLIGKRDRKRKPRGKLPAYVDGETYDLNTHQGREKLNRDCKKLFQQSDSDSITCPRCGRELTEKMYRYPFRFYDDRRCKCIYISRSKCNEEIERKKAKFFGS